MINKYRIIIINAIHYARGIHVVWISPTHSFGVIIIFKFKTQKLLEYDTGKRDIEFECFKNI